MFKWMAFVLAGLACCLTLPALNAGTDLGCLPPPLTQDYLKKTIHVEIKGKLSHYQNHREGPRDPKYPMPNVVFIDFWQVSAGGKSYQLDFRGGKHFYDLANKLNGQTVILSGTLEGNVVYLTELKADEGFVKETTEVEMRGQLHGQRRIPGAHPNWDIYNPFDVWNVAVDGKIYRIDFATPELKQLAETLDGKAVVLTGVLAKDTITVKTLTAAE